MRKNNKYTDKELRENIDATFRGRDFEYNEVLVKINKYKKNFFKKFICLFIIVVFVVSIFLIGRTDYYKQLNSTNWYEETAYLDNAHTYTEFDTDSDGTKTEITKYKRFYVYTGKDNVKYWHSQTGYSTQGEVGEELRIYVDENDNSKSLEIISFKYEDYGLIIFSSVLLLPIIIAYSFIIIKLYIKKIILNLNNKNMEQK